MVDSINPAGSGQPIQNTRKTQETQKASEKQETRSGPVDEVKISEEALNLSQAEAAAKDVGTFLANNSGATLSADQQRLSTLA
ncbi:MAG: hypothetical protein KJ017_01430 [Alphaproteobacteria bacterium]|nr:hypothetical protein [Alphaproteobacteria bacterium]